MEFVSNKHKTIGRFPHWCHIANVQSVAYLHSKEVLDAAGLHTITHYMDVSRQTVTNFIVN
jgi:hypothetical protein